MNVGLAFGGSSGDKGTLDDGGRDLVVVRGEDARLDLAGSSVDDNLLPGSAHNIDGVVASVNEDTVLVELLDLVESGEGGAVLPVVLLEEAISTSLEVVVELVLEEHGGRHAGAVLGVR